MNDDSVNNRWVAIVYDRGDKVGSHIFYGTIEEQVRGEANRWVKSFFGDDYRDWSLHNVCDR